MSVEAVESLRRVLACDVAVEQHGETSGVHGGEAREVVDLGVDDDPLAGTSSAVDGVRTRKCGALTRSPGLLCCRDGDVYSMHETWKKKRGRTLATSSLSNSLSDSAAIVGWKAGEEECNACNAVDPESTGFCSTRGNKRGRHRFTRIGLAVLSGRPMNRSGMQA